MVVFDITERQTFEHVKGWKKEIEQNADSDILCYLVGNFQDQAAERTVSTAEALQLMKELGFSHYIETSALTTHNIALLFETVTKHLFLINESKLKQFVSPSV